MTSWVVPDSGVLIASVMNEDEATRKAKDIWRYWLKTQTRIAVPHLFGYEVIASIRKNVYRRLLTVSDAETTLNILMLSIETMTTYYSPSLLKRAYEIATLLNRPTAYDSQYQDFRLARSKSRNVRLAQFSAQVIAEKSVLDSIQRALHLVGTKAQGKPGMVATAKMVTLGTGFATLAFFGASQLLEFAVQLLDVPTHGILSLKVVCG